MIYRAKIETSTFSYQQESAWVYSFWQTALKGHSYLICLIYFTPLRLVINIRAAVYTHTPSHTRPTHVDVASKQLHTSTRVITRRDADNRCAADFRIAACGQQGGWSLSIGAYLRDVTSAAAISLMT